MTQKNQIVIKNKVLVNISSTATLAQRRLFNAILSKVYDDIGDFTKQFFIINNQELIALLGSESKINYQRFLNDCKALMSTIITWNILKTDKGLEQFSISVLISSIQFDKGNLKIELPALLRSKLIENNQYIKFNLQLQNKFTSKYSLVIYELCKEFYREKEGIGESPWLEIENIRQLVGVEKNEYLAFKVFNKWVLKIAEKEINKESDISIRASYQRNSRKITHIKFHITENSGNKNQTKQSTNQTRSIIGDIESKQPTLTTTTPLHLSLLSQASTFGISDTLCSSWLSSFSPEYIQAKIDLTYSYIKQKKIKTSLSGFLIRAIQEDFGGKIQDIDNLLSQEALEARKLNPETFSLSPTDYSSQEEFEARIIDLESQYYNPRWSEMDMNIAQELWKLQKVVT